MDARAEKRNRELTGEPLQQKRSWEEQQGKEWTGTGTFSPNDSW